MYKAVNILIWLYCLTLLFSCQKPAGRQDNLSLKAIAVTDFRGETVSLDKPAQRIVCLIESALSGLYMLNAESQLIGISTNVYTEKVFEQYSVLDSRIKNKQLSAPGNWDFVNLEKVLGLKPDLVIMWASQSETIKLIELQGIPVYAVMLKSLNDVYKEIADLGKLTGKENRADSIISYTKKELHQISLKTDRDETKKKSVYFMWSQGLLKTSGTESTVNDLISMAGAKNACQLPNEHLTVNIEKVIEWNPDLIVMWYNERLQPSDLQNISGWSSMDAVKAAYVYELPSVFDCDLWTLKFQYAVKLLHNWCYPDHSNLFDLEVEKRQMLHNLYGTKAKELR